MMHLSDEVFIFDQNKTNLPISPPSGHLITPASAGSQTTACARASADEEYGGWRAKGDLTLKIFRVHIPNNAVSLKWNIPRMYRYIAYFNTVSLCLSS